jgi:hypothetical protein
MMFQPFILSLVLVNPNALLERAESNINASNWSEAAKALDEYVQTAMHPTAEAMYDRGIAHYQLGEFDIATKSFDEAMNTAQDPMLQTFSAFNFGNAMYQQTLSSLEGTGTGAPSNDAIIALEDAQDQIKQVLKSYRKAITFDQSDMDARANGELAWQMLQQLNQMQEQMEEQQQDDEQQQNQDEESADEQQENQEQKQDGSSEQEQQKKDGEQSKDQPENNQSEDQKQQGEKQEQQKNEVSEQSNQDQQQNGEQPEEQQEGEQSNQQQEEEGEQQEPQNPLDGELETTDEQMNEMKTPPTSLKDEGERLSEDEANRLLQLIRDKEQQRRKAIAARKAANRIPVGKDW